MHDWFALLGIGAWKGPLGALLISPLPLLLLALCGAWLAPRHRAWGMASLLIGVIGLWATGTPAVGALLVEKLTRPPPALDATQRAALVDAPHTAIVVLGSGIRLQVPEYGDAELKPLTLERLRYGLWLARQTHLPVAYSGGPGYGAPAGPTEADVARRVAEQDFRQPLRWAEDRSRDTNENAIYTVALLRGDGIQHIVLVTHGYHQRRALAAFERALARAGVTMSLLPAPVGVSAGGPTVLGDWLPRSEGYRQTEHALHEWIGRIVGA